MITYPAFLTSAFYKNGMSGGPIFGLDGRVIGVISTGYDLAEGYNQAGYGAPMGTILELQIDLKDQFNQAHGFKMVDLIRMGQLGVNRQVMVLRRDEQGAHITWIG